MKIWTKPELQIYDLDLLTKKVLSASASGGCGGGGGCWGPIW